MGSYILAYDIGTTGVKTCLFEVDKSIKLIKYASRSYPLYILDGGGAEQDADDWWRGMAESTKEILGTEDIMARVFFIIQMAVGAKVIGGMVNLMARVSTTVLMEK